MSELLQRFNLGSKEFAILGTAHISNESIEEVRKSITELQPAVVCVELDEARYNTLNQSEDAQRNWKGLDIGKVIKEGKTFLLLANLVLMGFQRRMGAGVGVKPGAEMVAALEESKKHNIRHVLCDREVHITLKRAWSKSSFWNKSKLIAALIQSAFSSEKLNEADIEQLKQGNELERMMEELAQFLPTIKQVLIDERDQYLAAKIYEAAQDVDIHNANNKLTFAVVGAGHLNGIVKHLTNIHEGKEHIELAKINSVPPPSKLSRVLQWLVPAIIVGAIVAGFFVKGTEVSVELLTHWILLNGGLAALGALLTLATPVTILVTFVSAPFATLNPLIGVGFFAALTEIFMRKPRVRDFENLSDDVMSIKGFYRNRVTHILLVFIATSLGGAIGNLISLPVFISKFFH